MIQHFGSQAEAKVVVDVVAVAKLVRMAAMRAIT